MHQNNQKHNPRKLPYSLDILVGTVTVALLGITVLDYFGLVSVPEKPMQVGYFVLGICVLYVRFFLPGTGLLRRY